MPLSRRVRSSSRIDSAAALLKHSCRYLPFLKQTHAHLLRSHLHVNPSLSSLLLSLYSPSSSLAVFSLVPEPNLSLFNHAIRSLAKSPTHSHSALHLYRRMIQNAVSPDNFTFPFLLSSCSSPSLLLTGQELHSRLLKSGFRRHIHVANALVAFYAKCAASPSVARLAFDEMPLRDVVSHNALLGAHARLGEDMDRARIVFDGMKEKNAITWNAMLVGYANARELELAREVFDAMRERNTVSWTVMIMGYCKSGRLDSARELFDKMPCRNMVCWTLMLSGYSQAGRPEESLSLFHDMKREGVVPDAAAMTGIISASSQMGQAELADRIELYVDRHGIERNERVLTALVDMHAKCGNLDSALRLFDEIPSPRDAFSYTALIGGFASHGHGKVALETFDRMRTDGVTPDRVTFVGVLSACSHAGLIDRGLEFWESMVRDYGIERGPDHYACMVDMLGRAGRLEEAYDMVGRMPMGRASVGALGALLAACRTYDNVEIAENVANRLFEVEPENTGNFVLMSSIYASREQWGDAARVRKMMQERGATKLPGSSWIEGGTQRGNNR